MYIEKKRLHENCTLVREIAHDYTETLIQISCTSFMSFSKSLCINLFTWGLLL